MNAKKAQPQEPHEKFLSREEILHEAAPLEPRSVQVMGWSGKIRMQNITFERLVELKVSAPDANAYHAMLIAEVCTDLSLEDAIKLQKGNGFKFATLYAAVESFGNGAERVLSDEHQKN